MVVAHVLYHRVEDTNDYMEPPVQLQQQPNSTDQINNDDYSVVKEWLSPDYDMPTNNKATSGQAHAYASLMNPDTSDRGYEQPIRKSTSNSEQRPHEYDPVIRQYENQAAPHKAHHYTSLTNPQPPTSHVYTDLTRSEEAMDETTGNDHQCLQEYCTVVRQEGKKVTMKFTISDPPEQHEV